MLYKGKSNLPATFHPKFCLIPILKLKDRSFSIEVNDTKTGLKHLYTWKSYFKRLVNQKKTEKSLEGFFILKN